MPVNMGLALKLNQTHDAGGEKSDLKNWFTLILVYTQFGLHSIGLHSI